uniref:Uncharacterized protein n=1 Tax=Physcomitrium patens TaxID=3218 RepID=A0A2K1JHJ2_PHYPA|nr:hypothetical protein PHYPA_018428 [Physcomitrium patens]
MAKENSQVWTFIYSYCNYFVFSFEDLEDYKSKLIHIQLKDDHSIL